MFEKNKKELDAELLASFSPMITCRAFSFYENGQFCDYINDTLNTYHRVFQTNEDKFKFFENVIPKLKRKKYNYISKPKVEEKSSRVIPEFYSERELDLFDNLSKYDYGTTNSID